MATDYGILESELSQTLAMMKRNLHMMEVRKLARKHIGLSKHVVQRRQIMNLESLVEDLLPTVSRLYSLHHALKDNEIKGYLVYLLEMRDYFAREVITKQETIQQREEQIKIALRKLCSLTNEYARRQKANLPKSAEFIKWDNMCGRMNRIENRLSCVRQENKELREDILDMRIFHGQYKKFEDDFRHKIKNMKEKGRMHLERAVTAYEEREDYISKGTVFDERRNQDIRKAAFNENALNLFLEKTNKNETFKKLQDTFRNDIRIKQTQELIDSGLTGLEPTLEDRRGLKAAIVEASGHDTPQDMEQGFRLTEDRRGSLFSYLEELMQEMNNCQKGMDELRDKNRRLLKGMTDKERKLRWEIDLNKNEAQDKKEEAEKAITIKNEVKQELDSLLEAVRTVFKKCCPRDVQILEEADVEDRNVIDYLQHTEKQMLEYLMFIEYIRMKEASEDEVLPLGLEEHEGDIIDVTQEEDPVNILEPRPLRSEDELKQQADVEGVLEFEELREIAATVVSEIESAAGSEKSDEEDIA